MLASAREYDDAVHEDVPAEADAAAEVEPAEAADIAAENGTEEHA